jgi:hypothetical protein
VWLLLVSLLVSMLTGPLAASAAQPATAAVTGIIVDARTRQPLPGAVVELQTPYLSTATDAEGRFRFDAVPLGARELVVSMVGFGFTRYAIQVTAADTPVTLALAEGPAAYHDTVTVHGGDVFGARDPGVVGHALGSGEVKQLGGMTLDDPLRAVQSLAGVAAADDFYGDISVRGDSFRRLNYTVDNVPAQFLQHTLKFVEDGASIAMVNGDVVDQAFLQRGAYSQKFYDRLGAALTLTSSEGSRERRRYNLTASGTSASITADGPLGKEAKGSWIVSFRRSYLDLFLEHVLSDDTTPAFSFTDIFSTVAYDLSPHDHVEATMVAGQSRYDKDVGVDTLSLARADHTGWMATGAWRHTGTSWSLTQRLFVTGEAYNNRNGLDAQVADGDGSDLGYRMDVSFGANPSLQYDAGVSIERIGARELLAFRVPGWHVTGGDDFSTHTSTTGAYGQMRWTRGPVTITPGTRVDRFGATSDWTASPWLQASWQASPRLTFIGNTGLQHQFPELFQVAGRRGRADLDPERAINADAGVELRPTPNVRLQVTAYNREERDLIDLPDQYYHVRDGVLLQQSDTSLYDNRLKSTSRGVEFMLQRKAPRGLSGWVAYTYGHTRATDRVTGERFDGDYDQRHTLNLFGAYRLTDRMSVNARYRYGSNRPIAGYIDTVPPDDHVFVGSQRNALRVPVYSRLDLRGDRTYRLGGCRLTLFFEIANLLNRENFRQVPQSIDGRTGQVFTSLGTLFPIVPSIGATLEF